MGASCTGCFQRMRGAGRRRLAACKLLGWSSVPVHVVPLDDLVLGEWTENAVRKDLLPSEKVAIGKALEPRERDEAENTGGIGGAWIKPDYHGPR